jgi:hypothetical protein
MDKAEPEARGRQWVVAPIRPLSRLHEAPSYRVLSDQQKTIERHRANIFEKLGIATESS